MKKFNKKLIAAGVSAAAAVTALSLSALSSQAADTLLYGDANCDNQVSIADAACILQHLANGDRYPLDPLGQEQGDVNRRGDGITPSDALSIQKYLAKVVAELPESWETGHGPAVTTAATTTQPTVTTTTGTTDPAADITYITLKGTSIDVKGSHAAVSGNKVVIDHSGTFYVSGTLEDGQIEVNVPDEKADPDTVKIFLNGVSIAGKSAPAVLVTNAENTSINLVDGTENTITDGDTAYTGGGAVIEAKDDITIKGGEMGTGTLTLTANTQNGIACNNDIKINGGVIKIKTNNKTDKTNGINGKKSVTIKDGTVDVNAEGDGIKSSKGDVKIEGGSVTVKAGNDAVQAETTIDISGGSLIAGGDRGLTAVTGINITGGDVVATAKDNQVDAKLLSGTAQGTILFNMAACPDSEDGTWKKDNSFGGFEFTKKYSYVLMSTPNFAVGTQHTFQNKLNESAVMYGTGNFTFSIKEIVNTYNEVNPSAAVPPTVTPPAETENHTLTFSGSTAKSSAPSDAVSVSSGSVTILQPGSYDVSGEGKDVQIIVDVDKTKYPDGIVELNLTGVTLTNSTTAPIYVANIGDEVQIIAKKGTVNVISDGTQHTQTYTDKDGSTSTVEGAIFARDDIKFKGAGSLTVNGNTDDAIVCKNDIKIFNGNITVNAKDDGIRGKDSVTIGKADDTDFSGLKLTVITEEGDGIKSTASDAGNGIVTINGGTVDIKSCADGIQGEQDVVINGGDINIYTYQGSGYTGSGTTTGGNTGGWGGGRPGGGGGFGMDGNPNKVENSAKSIKALGLYDSAGTTWQSGGNITITGGNITIDSSDDAIHCGGNLNITGGQFKIATADDALHADHDLTLGTKGGAYADFGIYVTKCYEGVEGQNINQYSGTVVVKADDDGYNAAGGSDGSGNQNPGGFFPGGGFGSSGNYSLNIAGGIAIVQSASGDHDAFDSNGSLSVTGGIVIANGQEPLDADGTNTASGGTVLAVSSQSTGTVASGTQFTVADSSGKVIVSFRTMQGMGGITTKHTDTTVSMYTGGTITGGTDLITLDDTQKVYADGTITGGTAVTAGSSSTGGNTRPGFGR